MPTYSTAQFRQYVVDLLQQATGLTISIPTILSTAEYRGLVVDLLTVLAQGGGGGSTNATQLQGRNISATAPTSGQILGWNGTVWIPTTVSGTGTVTSVAVSGGATGLTTSGGPITGSGTITLAGTLNVANGGTGAATLTGYVKGSGTSAFTASASIPAGDVSGTLAASNLPALSGDVTSTAGSNSITVAKLRGQTVSATVPTLGQILKFDGTQWAPAADAGGISSITAGTGLSGGTITTSGTIAVNFGTTTGTVTQGGTTVLKAGDSMTGALSIALNTNTAGLSVTQSGNGHAFVIGADLLTISHDGHLGIGLTPNSSHALRVDTGGIFTQGGVTFGDNSVQTTAGITSLTGDVTTSGAGASAATVARIQGRAVSATAPTSGQDLEWSGTAWTPSNKLKFSSTKVVGVDAATIQGCIDLVTSASWNNQTQILIPAGIYTENLTLKPCVSLASVGGNNGQGSVVRIVGTHTATGSSTAGDSVLELNGIRFDNSTTTATLTFSANGTVPFLVHMQDCMVGNSNSSTAVSGVVVNNYVSIRAVNIRSLANSTAGSGGTHWDLNGGSLYAQGCSTEYGTRALLMRGTNGSFYPYAELKASYFSASGADLISITSATALLTAGWCSFENKATTGNGINIAAGSTAGVYKSAFIITSGASNYVVTGAAGCAYFSTGNSYSNSSAVPYETKIGASVAQYAYTSTDVSKSGDTMSGKLTLTNNGTTAPLNLGAQANVGTLTGGDLWINSSGVLSWRTTAGATITAVTTSALTSFVAGVGAAIGSSTTPALVVQQNGTNAAMTVTNVSSSNTDCVTITNLGSGNSLVVNDETTPDSTRFAISASGRVGIGVAPDATVGLSVDSTGIKFGDGTIQTTAGGAGGVSSFTAGTTGLTPATSTTGAVTLAGTLNIANGGTGATTAANAINALVPSQSGQSGKVLTTNGSVVSWGTAGGGGITALTGDVTASGSGSVSATVTSLRGRALSTNTPLNGQVLQYNATVSEWQPSASATGAIVMVAYTNVGFQSGVSLPAGYKWADIYVCSGAGGGGGGMDCMNGYNNGGAYGGGGGGGGLSEFLQKIPIDNATFEFEIGAGGAGGVGQSTYAGQNNTDGGDGMPTYLKMSRLGVNRTLSDLAKYTETSALNTTGALGGNWGGGGGICSLINPSTWRSTLTQGGSGTYNNGNASGYTYQNNVGRPISVSGSSGAGIATTPNDGGPITNIKYPNLDYSTNTLFQYQGKATSGAQDALPLPTLSLGDVDFDSLNFLGGAGGASGDITLNIPLSSPLFGYRAGHGADGQLGCGGGGGGAIGGPTFDTSTPYYGGDGGDGGQGYIIFICYN